MGVVLMSKRELNRINPSWTSTAAQRLLSGDIHRCLKRDGALAAMHLQGAKERSMFDAVNLA
jgi:hypothetical protein